MISCDPVPAGSDAHPIQRVSLLASHCGTREKTYLDTRFSPLRLPPVDLGFVFLVLLSGTVGHAHAAGAAPPAGNVPVVDPRRMRRWDAEGVVEIPVG